MAKISVADMEARKLEVMKYLAARTDDQGMAVVSRRCLMEDLSLTPAQLRLALSCIREAGMVLPVPRYSENGAQCENAYRITARGIRHVRLSLGAHASDS